jgi:hypothetical protein
MTAPTNASSMQLWQGITQTPDIVAHFRGIFNKAAFTVTETGETFTATHHGDRITLAEGIDPNADFTVPLQLENVQRLAAQTRDGRIPPAEAWRIAQVLFTPLTQTTLKNPVLSVNWVRWVAGVENLIHVHLVNPEGGDAATHTLLYTGDQWVVLPGLHGQARRVYRLTPEQSLDYQRHVFHAIQQNNLGGWWSFARWYRAWRQDVSVSD